MSEQKDLLLGGGLLSLAGAKVMHTHFVTPPSIYGVPGTPSNIQHAKSSNKKASKKGASAAEEALDI